MLIFSLELEISGVSYVKNGVFFKELLSENDFEAVLGFSVVMTGANSSAAVQKITTDQKD